MRSFLTIILIVVCGTMTLCAQTISKKALFYQGIDYVTCKIVEISMRNSGDTQLFTQYQRACPCTLGKNAVDFEDIAAFLKSEEVGKTLSLATEINSGKKEYSPNMSDSDMVEFMTDNLFRKKYGQVHAFRTNPKHSTNVEALRVNLKEKLSGYMVPFFSESFLPDDGDATMNGQLPTPKVQEKAAEKPAVIDQAKKSDAVEDEEGSGIFGKFTTFLLLLACIGLGLLLYQRTKKYGKLQDLYKSEKDKSVSYEKLLGQRDAEKEVYVNKIAAKNKKLEELELLLAGRTNAAAAAVPAREEAVAPTIAEPVQEEFYLSTPNEDGSFNDNGKSKIFKPTASLYHFVVSETDKHIAAFAFVNEESAIVRALNYPDTCLLPVCQELNAHHMEARAIKTEEPGLVELVNDKWVLREKAQIVYV